MNFSVTKNGQPLSKDLYTWDEKTRTFSTNESYLVLDFSGINDCTFKTGYNCTFKTGSGCHFETGSGCHFETGFDCHFYTDFGCTFKTDFGCTFNIISSCTFDTGSKCVIIRRDIFEVVQLLDEENHIKLNGIGIKGYEVIMKKHIITIDGKNIELSKESFENLKKQII